MGIMLSLQEVTKIYPGAEHIKAVDSLSFDLEEGEICTNGRPLRLRQRLQP